MSQETTTNALKEIQLSLGVAVFSWGCTVCTCRWFWKWFWSWRPLFRVVISVSDVSAVG